MWTFFLYSVSLDKNWTHKFIFVAIFFPHSSTVSDWVRLWMFNRRTQKKIEHQTNNLRLKKGEKNKYIHEQKIVCVININNEKYSTDLKFSIASKTLEVFYCSDLMNRFSSWEHSFFRSFVRSFVIFQLERRRKKSLKATVTKTLELKYRSYRPIS